MRTYTATILARQTITVITDDERQVERLAVEQVKAKLGESVVIVTSFEIEAGERKETCGRIL